MTFRTVFLASFLGSSLAVLLLGIEMLLVLR
jgi:hypothetical protein